MNQDNITQVVKKRWSKEKPQLLENEVIKIEGCSSFNLIDWLSVLLVTLIPPFIFGIFLFLLILLIKKKSVFWVTNKRIVYSKEFFLFVFIKRYYYISVPVSLIEKVIPNKGVPPMSPGLFLAFLNYFILNVSDVHIFTYESMWSKIFPKLSIKSIKKPTKITEEITELLPKNKT